MPTAQIKQTLQGIARRQARVRSHVLAYLAVHGRSYVGEVADSLSGSDRAMRVRETRHALQSLERDGLAESDLFFPAPSDTQIRQARRYYWLVA
jgi:hypothetical protein